MEKNSYLAINSKNYETTEQLIEAVGWDQYQDQTLKIMLPGLPDVLNQKISFLSSLGVWPFV